MDREERRQGTLHGSGGSVHKSTSNQSSVPEKGARRSLICLRGAEIWTNMDFNLQGRIIRAPSLNHKPYDSDYVCIAPSGKQDVPHRFMVKRRNFHTKS